jgi:SET domain-containing protein
VECHALKPKLTELRALQNAKTVNLPISALKRRKRRKWAKMGEKNYLEKKISSAYFFEQIRLHQFSAQSEQN